MLSATTSYKDLSDFSKKTRKRIFHVREKIIIENSYDRLILSRWLSWEWHHMTEIRYENKKSLRIRSLYIYIIAHIEFLESEIVKILTKKKNTLLMISKRIDSSCDFFGLLGRRYSWYYSSMILCDWFSPWST